MTLCNCKIRCPVLALIVSAIIGVLAAFFQITGVITVAPVFLWVVFGISVVYLAVQVLAAVLRRDCEMRRCTCASLQTVLAGILGAALISLILLAVGITATSVLSALLVGLLLFFFSLILTGTACYVNCVTDCDR